MNGTVEHTTALAPLDVLALRAWAQALLLAEGEIESVAAAVDPLQEFAERAGLDQDATQQILANAFAPLSRACL
jgi:hypothetical protein